MIKIDGINIANDIFNQYSYVKKLFIEKKPENCIFEEKNEKIHFMGNIQDQILVWKNLYTDELVEDDIIYTDRELINNNYKVQIGSFILDNLNLKDNIVKVDLSVLDKKVLQQLKLYVELISDSEINNQKKIIMDNGNLESSGKKFDPISRIFYNSITESIYVQDFKENYLISHNNLNIYLLKKEQQFFIDQIKHNILFADRIVPYNLNRKLLNYIEVSMQLEQQVSAELDVGEMVSLLKRIGYLYLKPFMTSDLKKNAKILVIANRKIDIEIYEKNKNMWICLQNNKINQVHNELVRLRLCVEAGDIIDGIAIVQ